MPPAHFIEQREGTIGHRLRSLGHVELAQRACCVVAQPRIDALLVERMIAGQEAHAITFHVVIEAHRAAPSTVHTNRDDRHLTKHLGRHANPHVPDALLQREQLLVRHPIDVNSSVLRATRRERCSSSESTTAAGSRHVMAAWLHGVGAGSEWHRSAAAAGRPSHSRRRPRGGTL